jgi:hypothetical protein
LFRLFGEPTALEWRHKVGVVGPVDGSAKATSRLLAVNGWVLKTNAASAAPSEHDAAAKVEKAAELGQRARVWHPDKTWGVYRSDDRWYPLSATPELETLRQVLGAELRLRIWTAMLARAVEVALASGIGLDLNPANFGTAAGDPRLYYIDDEWYPEFTLAEFASAVVARIAEEPEIDEDEWRGWGSVVAPVLQPLCAKVDARMELVSKLAEHPVAGQFEAKRAALCAGLRDTLLEKPRHASQGPESQNRTRAERAVIADVRQPRRSRPCCAGVEGLGVTNYVFSGDAVGYGPIRANVYSSWPIAKRSVCARQPRSCDRDGRLQRRDEQARSLLCRVDLRSAVRD